MENLGPPGRCRVCVVGPLAGSVMDVICSRFDAAATATADGTLLTVDGVDQAAIRALLIALWDSGHQVLAMTTGRGRVPNDSICSITNLAVHEGGPGAG